MPSATRPSGYPLWGVSATNITTPPSTYTTSGWSINERPPSSYENWLRQLTGQWIQYLDAGRGAGLFGDGSDGDHILDGVTGAPSWATKAGAVYRLSRDTFANSIVMTGASTQIFTGPWRLFVAATLTTPGFGGRHVNCDGPPGANGSSGGFFSSPTGTLKVGGAGGAGGVSVSGGAGAHVYDSFGGTGGTGGTETVGLNNPGAAGRASGMAAYRGTPRNYGPSTVGYLVGGGGAVAIQGGGGGGGGSSEGGNSGGGGAGGGVLVLCARALAIATGTDLSARGGNGASGTASSAGGGSGGGGVMIVVYEKIPTGIGFTGPVNCAPGTPGGPQSGTLGGTTGVYGTVYAIQI